MKLSEPYNLDMKATLDKLP